MLSLRLHPFFERAECLLGNRSMKRVVLLGSAFRRLGANRQKKKGISSGSMRLLLFPEWDRRNIPLVHQLGPAKSFEIV